jgi:hypothetical protein
MPSKVFKSRIGCGSSSPENPQKEVRILRKKFSLSARNA